ncbi:HNH endonuclease [Blastococcus sp. SYSU DS0533]
MSSIKISNEIESALPSGQGRGAWLVLAVDGKRQHGGNDGYDDNPSVWYSWDSTVPNSASLQPGDLIAVWDKLTLLGVSVIQQIRVAEKEKARYTCPHCGKASFKARETVTPKFLCFKCGHQFDEPVVRHERVKTFRSYHEAAWVDAGGALGGAELRALCESPRAQNSLRRLRQREFLDVLDRVVPAARDLLQHPALDHRDGVPGGHRRAIARVRIGQARFRARLLHEQGEICAFSGPMPAAALDAAHLYSYALAGVHDAGGGLLLRRDLHRLFDLGDIAVDPATRRVDVRRALRRFPEYGRLHDQNVKVQLTGQQMSWIAEHWAAHRMT